MVKSIATFDAITTIAQEEKVSITDDTLKIGSACFDAGAREILRHVAIVDLESGDPVKCSNYTKRLSRECEEKYKVVENMLSKEGAALLKQYDDFFHDMAAGEAHDYYIEGFIRGYVFMKYHVSHRVGAFE
jgi:hypothetical protein